MHVAHSTMRQRNRPETLHSLLRVDVQGKAGKSMSTDQRIEGEIVQWPVEQMRLDPENPRLAETQRDATQSELLQTFYTAYELEPLLLSLSQHGYFSEEPLIGIRSIERPSGTEIFTIVEGNRRLAALQILLFDGARDAVAAEGLPELAPGVLGKLNPVPVKEYFSRSDVVPYLGVRHIRGVKDWDPLAKARYVRWLKNDGYSVPDIVRIVGGRRDVVQRWLLTLFTLEQSNVVSDSPWSESPDEFKFSWLYTSLGYARIRGHLGLGEEELADPQPNPVEAENSDALIQHMHDLYGPPPGNPRLAKVKDSRQIRQLAAVYASPQALDLLRAGEPLTEAYSRSVGEQEELLDYLRRINRDLERAISIAHRHKGQAHILRLAEQAADAGQALVNNLN